MNYARARTTVIATFREKNGPRPNSSLQSAEIHLRAQSIELVYVYPNASTRYVAAIKELGKVTVVREKRGHQYEYALFVEGRDPGKRERGVYPGLGHDPASMYWLISMSWNADTDDPVELAKAQDYAEALNVLSAHARGEDHAQQEAGWREFQQKAAAWRALPTKPPLSDDVRMHRLMAEDALKQKQFDQALAEYEAGLEIDPLWPEGHYNAALLYGELPEYEWAVWHMQAYLELRPDAPDAPQARDQLLLWQGKLKQ
jgi:tetratricopeptide (TPR) repeat protein